MRKLLIILAISLLLVFIATGVVAFLVDPEDYRDYVQTEFSRATGQDILIGGEMRASLFPRPFLEVTQASVPGGPGNGGPPLAEVDSVRLYPRLAPLFTGRLEWGLVRIEGLRLQPARPEPRLDVEALDVSVGPIVPHEPISIRMKGSMLDTENGSSVELGAEGNLIVSEGLQPTRLEQLVVGLDGFGLAKGVAANFLLRGGVDLDLDARRYLADEATLEIRVFGDALSGGEIEAKASARVNLDLTAERLEVDDLSIRSGALSVKGRVLGQILTSGAVLTGDLVVDELDLRAWLERQGLPVPRTADAETFRSFSLNAGWRWEDARLGLQDLVLNIDETAVTGKIDQVASRPPDFRFDLVADRLDLDRYLPVPRQTSAKKGKVPQRPVTVDGPVASEEEPSFAPQVETPEVSGPSPGPTRPRQPVTTVGMPSLEGRLRIGDLELARLGFGDADLAIRVKDGNLEIDDRIGRFYGGRIDGSLALDLRGSQPGVTLAQRADGIRIGLLLADLGGKDRLTGRGSIVADLTATGGNADTLKRSLAGNLAVHIPQGVVKGVNLERMVREAEARLRGKRPPKGLPTQTEFKDLHASAKVQGGVLRNRDLVATASNLRITGSGILDLVEEHIDYRFEARFVKPLQGRRLRGLEGIPIPVRVTGPFGRPHWEVDVAAALREAAVRGLGEQGGDLLKDLEERTGIKGLEKGLRDLLGR